MMSVPVKRGTGPAGGVFKQNHSSRSWPIYSQPAPALSPQRRREVAPPAARTAWLAAGRGRSTEGAGVLPAAPSDSCRTCRGAQAPAPPPRALLTWSWPRARSAAVTPMSLTGLTAGATGEPLSRARGGPRPTEKLAGSPSPQGSDHSLSRAGTRAAARSCLAPATTTSPKRHPTEPAPVPAPGRQGAPEAAPLARRPNRWGLPHSTADGNLARFPQSQDPCVLASARASAAIGGGVLQKCRL